MKTPSYRQFITEIGKTVHHLNTIAVGLSGVESGACIKPDGLDISWNPSDIVASSRNARLFTLKATIVFVAEELSSYTKSIISSPNIGDVSLPKDPKRFHKHEALCNKLGLTNNQLVLGPLLLIHWRNKIIHKNSKAALTKAQKADFVNCREVLLKKYKNLCVDKLLKHYQYNQPTLKDVSSLVAMSINLVNELEGRTPEPRSYEDVVSWLNLLGLYEEFERIQRVAKNKPKPEVTINNFFITSCPELRNSYELYCAKQHA